MAGEDELRDAADGWQRAIEARDVQRVGEYLDPDFALVLVQPQRSVVQRDDWLRTLPDYQEHEWRPEELVIDVDGDVGLMLQRVFMRATVRGRDHSGIFVITDVWRLRDGRWRVWRRHSTPLSAGPIPEPAEDPAGG